jgi:hypothetical protein
MQQDAAVCVGCGLYSFRYASGPQLKRRPGTGYHSNPGPSTSRQLRGELPQALYACLAPVLSSTVWGWEACPSRSVVSTVAGGAGLKPGYVRDATTVRFTVLGSARGSAGVSRYRVRVLVTREHAVEHIDMLPVSGGGANGEPNIRHLPQK